MDELTILTRQVPGIAVMTDIALDPYNINGHDGYVRDGRHYRVDGESAKDYAPDEGRIELENIARKYKDSVDREDIEEIIKNDEAFHKYIVSLSGNKTLIKMVSQVQELALRFRYIYYEDFSRFKNQPSEHQAIVDAIAGGDVAGARKYAEEHLAGLKDFVRREGSKLSKHVVNVHLK